MLKYIISDMLATLRYLPYGIIAGLFAVLILHGINRGRKRRGKDTVSLPAVSCLVMYVAVLLVITYFSRESGTRGGLDLEFFSHGASTSAITPMWWKMCCCLFPMALCWPGPMPGREIFQEPFHRGADQSCHRMYAACHRKRLFQIDDILTNILGTILGFLCYWLLYGICGLFRK